jgi:hypothetical protein
LDYKEFGLQSTGDLMLVADNPVSSQATPIPFTLLLRRNGAILNESSMEFIGQELYSVEISSVLQYAKPGDHLIINPVNQRYWKAKRILKLINKDGC